MNHYVRALAHHSSRYAQIQLWNPGGIIIVIDEIKVIVTGSMVLLRNDGVAYRLPLVADGYNPGTPSDFTSGTCSQGACSVGEIRHASEAEVLGTILEQGVDRFESRTQYRFGPNQGIMIRPGAPNSTVRATFKWHEI